MSARKPEVIDVPFVTDYSRSLEEMKRYKIIRRADLKLLEAALDGNDLDLARYALNLLKMGATARQQADVEAGVTPMTT